MTASRKLRSATVALAALRVTGRLRLASLRRHRAPAELPKPVRGPRVLVLTARVGGGHEAVGRTVGAELQSAGYTVESRDGLRAMSGTLNWALTRGYRGQARHMPGTLGAIFALTSHPGGAGIVRRMVGVLYARRLFRIIRETRPDAVISTYPLVTAALGHLRGNGTLDVPAIAVIPDYGVHPLWVVPGLDLHVVASRTSAELVANVGGVASPVRMPVAAGFRNAPDKEVARISLDIPPDAFVALLVGGVWGIGDLEGAAACAVESGAYTVVVTGENKRLKHRLEKRFNGVPNARILGWRDDMPLLMAAADCLVQNAGGMTCMEAIEVGLPILIFNPISGHGEFNAEIMEREGVARTAHTPDHLLYLLREAASGGTIRLRGDSAAKKPEIEAVLGEVLESEQRLPGAPPARRRLRPALAGVAAVFFLFWSLFASSGVAVAARALSLDVVGVQAQHDRAALAVRVTEPETAAAVEDLARNRRLPLTIFATADGAKGMYPASGLSFGVAEDLSSSVPVSWSDRREARRAAASVERATGIYPEFFLPSRRTNLAALAEAPPRTALVMTEPMGAEKRRAGVLLVDVSGLAPSEARSEVNKALEEMKREGLECVPLERL